MYMHRIPGGGTITSLSGGLSSTQQPPSHDPSIAASLRDDDYGIPILQLSTDTDVSFRFIFLVAPLLKQSATHLVCTACFCV